PRPQPTSTLFPYTTLFRSSRHEGIVRPTEHSSKPRLFRSLMTKSATRKCLLDEERYEPFRPLHVAGIVPAQPRQQGPLFHVHSIDRKSTRLNSSHVAISYA